MGSLSAPISLTLAQIQQLVGGTLHGHGAAVLSSLSSLNDATPQALAFIANDHAAKIPGGIKAGGLLVHRHFPDLAIPQLVVPNPLLAFAQVAQTFFVRPPAPRGIAADVTTGAGVQIGDDPSIWPFVTLGDRVTIGARVTLYPGVYIGADSTVGDDSVLYPNVVVREGCSIGARVIIHGGTVIGADGFGYVQHEGRHHKIPQLGGVTIEDDVELGAHVTIDRATLGRTVVKRGTKIDNLVQIAHGVAIGRNVLLAAQVGIAGSVTIEDDVTLAGQVGVAGHITLGKGVVATAQTGIPNSVEPGEFISGYPAIPNKSWLRSSAVFRKLPELKKRVAELERRIKELEDMP
jgi:UDP-3-O-[3-hydroxymyristoyl] glucosamine N-acyltransferase